MSFNLIYFKVDMFLALLCRLKFIYSLVVFNLLIFFLFVGIYCLPVNKYINRNKNYILNKIFSNFIQS